MPGISIIIPCYNTEATLNNCVDSVKAQSFSDWELFLVDDGSTDGSLKLCMEFAEKDQRIHVLTQDHQGVSAARNLALTEVTGKYTCFIDSDDTVEVDYLETLYARREYDLVICGYYVDTYQWGKEELKNRKICISTETCYDDLSNKDNLECLFQSGLVHMNWNKMFHTDIIAKNNIRYHKYPINEDYIFVLDYLKYVKRISTIAKSLYHWKRYDGRISGVDSIPQNILSIYNESHVLTRAFFNNNTISDRISYLSYNMLVNKYLRFAEKGIITRNDAIRFLKRMYENKLVKAAYDAYRPSTKGEWFLYQTEKRGLYQLRYFLHKIISQCKGL